MSFFGKKATRLAAGLVIALSFLPGFLRAEAAVYFREDFRDLNDWEHISFPKIERCTDYAVVKEGGRSILRAESRASASAIVLKQTFDVQRYPLLRWRWKVENVYQNAKGRGRAADDYPLRIYVIFAFDPGNARLVDKALYKAMKAVFGEYPPGSSLNYVWASDPQAGEVFVSPYTDKARMVVLERGAAKAGQWVEETVDILRDYRKAFGHDPPATPAGLAIMSDSDNTGEAAVSSVEFIEIRAPAPDS